MIDLDNLKNQLQVIAKYGSAMAVLGWDEEVNLPPNGHVFRGEVLAQLSADIHKRLTDKQFVTLLNKLNKPDSLKKLSLDNQVIVRETKKDVDLATKLPTEFIERSVKLSSKAFPLWAKAREKSDFSIFAPVLEETIKLKQEEAELIGYKDSPYDALLDAFEPGMNTKKLDAVFEPLAKSISDMIKTIAKSPKLPTTIYDLAKQNELNHDIVATIGYDLESGRIDTSPHPFQTTLHVTDVRVTTRYDEKDFWVSLGSVIHETGHAMYEQGLPAKYWGTPRGESMSLGIHESQSRLWENFVCKSQPFVSYLYPLLVKKYGTLKYTEEQLYKWLNRVERNPIRVESDEVTYNLHIIIRYEIEKDLMEGKLQISDLPRVWNEKMKQYLGLDVANDALGVLQDVHWAHGAVGYFPSYTLGNLNAAQLYAAAKKAMPSLEAGFAKGEFKQLLDWLRVNIHSKGRTYSSTDLIKHITGEDLNPAYLAEHLETKIKLAS